MESEPWIAFGLELQDLGPKGGSTLHCFQTLGVFYFRQWLKLENHNLALLDMIWMFRKFNSGTPKSSIKE